MNTLIANRDEHVALARGLNRFSFALYRQVLASESTTSGNLCLSPYSVAASLSLLELGSKGDAQLALLGVLSDTMSPEDYRRCFSSLATSIAGGETPRKRYGIEIFTHLFRSASSLWVARDYAIDDDFIEAARLYYHALAGQIDVTQPDESANLINRWVADNTNHKIRGIVSPSMIKALTRVIVVNAVYFAGRWQEPFYESATKESDFLADGIRTVRVPMMRQRDSFRYFANDGVKLIELPYWDDDGTRMHMLILLPEDRGTLTELEHSLDADILDAWSTAADYAEVEVWLPRWKSKWGQSLSGPLKSVGLDLPFSDDADFSGISSESGLHVDEVVHKTFVAVDEKGTEAAAATSISVEACCMSDRVVEFHADRPFFYAIRDSVTGLLAFMGRINDPSEAR